MDRLDRRRLGQRQQIVVAFEMAGAAGESFAAEMRLLKPERLHLGAHCAIDHQDALGRLGAEARLGVDEARRILAEGIGHGHSLTRRYINA